MSTGFDRVCKVCGKPIPDGGCVISAKTRDGDADYHVYCAEQKITVYGVNQETCGSTIYYDRVDDMCGHIRRAVVAGMLDSGDQEVFIVSIVQMSRVAYDCLPEGEC